MIKQMLNLLHSLLIAGLFILLSACSSEQEALENYINQTKSRPAQPIEPIPELKPVPQYEYPENVIRRSPFRPVVIKSEEAPDQNRKKQPLENFPLDALKFVGILKRGTNTWALIQEPSGKVTYIKRGQYMGKDFGQVIEIADDSIRIEESVNISGKWQKKETKLELYKKQQ